MGYFDGFVASLTHELRVHCFHWPSTELTHFSSCLSLAQKIGAQKKRIMMNFPEPRPLPVWDRRTVPRLHEHESHSLPGRRIPSGPRAPTRRLPPALHTLQIQSQDYHGQGEPHDYREGGWYGGCGVLPSVSWICQRQREIQVRLTRHCRVSRNRDRRKICNRYLRIQCLCLQKNSDTTQVLPLPISKCTLMLTKRITS